MSERNKIYLILTLSLAVLLFVKVSRLGEQKIDVLQFTIDPQQSGEDPCCQR